MRPRFEVVAPHPPEEVARRLREALALPETLWRGDVYGAHSVFYVPLNEEHVWSPFLSLDLQWQGEGTLVRGRFGPKPSIWTLFVAAYAVCGCLAFFALAFGWSQWWIGQPAWALAMLPVTLVGALVVYGLARYGQRRGQEQMEALRCFLEETVDVRV